ncbi:MAG: ligT [Xanthomonadaceae bacterium]|nr:ligT [Xanthomonadaceae bacterium]
METAAEAVHRLFFALWPDRSLRAAAEEVAARVAAEQCPVARAVRAERYHLTLQFLGDFQPPSSALIEAAMSAAGCVPAKAFDLTLNWIDRFPGSRVGWLGTDASPPQLLALHEALERALAAQGVDVAIDQKFTPHVTILRDVSTLTPRPVSPITWSVDAFVLIDSRPGTPAPYRILGQWPLMRR